MHVLQDSGRGAPYIVILVRHGMIEALLPAKDVREWRRWFSGVHEEVERHLEGGGYLGRVELQREFRAHEGDDGHDAKAGAGEIGIEKSERLCQSPVEADLLFRFALGGVDGISSMRSTLPPGNAIWPACDGRASVRWVKSTSADRA